MFKDIKRLIGEEDYKVFMKANRILVFDAVCHAFIYSMLFLILLDLVNKDVTRAKLLKYTLAMVVMIFIRYRFLNKGFYLAQAGGATVIAHLRIKMGDYIKKLNMGYFSKNNVGELTNILSNDLNDFEMLITHQTADLIKYFILTLYLALCLILFDPFLGGIQVLTLVIIFPVSYLCSKKIKEVGLRSKQVRARMLARIMEYTRGIEVFKSYRMSGERFEKLSETLEQVKKESINVELAGVPYIVPMNILSLVMFPIVLYMGVNRYFEGGITLQRLTMFIIISLAFTNVEMAFSGCFVISRYFTLSIDKLLSVLNTPEIPYRDEDHAFENFDIEFKKVDFSYVEGKKVLSDVSFKARENEITALVGKSGSGKSTVMNLIARFFDVDGGEILIGGYDIRNVYADSLLKNMSIVFQDVYLIEDTIYENIRIGKQDATREEVLEAAKLAHCHEFVEKLEKGYDTPVHEGGTTLSGGERQRISIARAFLKNAPIILLDEATASLDVDNEYMVQESIRILTKGKTVLVIAHRLNTIMDAHQILVFDGGRIIEGGSHHDLMEAGGTYASMFTTMSKAKEWSI